MNKEQFSAWQVAPAVLWIDEERNPWGEYRNYEWITEAVIATGLSGLTEYGGVTPCNTMQRDIREKPNLFLWADREEPGEHPKGWVKINRSVAQSNPDICKLRDILASWIDAGRLELPK